MNITVYAETSASSHVTEEIAAELHEFRVSVRRGRISLDVAGQRLGGRAGNAAERCGKTCGKRKEFWDNFGENNGKSWIYNKLIWELNLTKFGSNMIQHEFSPQKLVVDLMNTYG